MALGHWTLDTWTQKTADWNDDERRRNETGFCGRFGGTDQHNRAGGKGELADDLTRSTNAVQNSGGKIHGRSDEIDQCNLVTRYTAIIILNRTKTDNQE